MTTPEKRKLTMYLIMPVFVLLFSALGFYALGGGHGTVERATANSGINTRLPGAQLQKDAGTDKLSLLDQAQKDSASAKSHSAAGAFAALGWDTAKLHSAPVNSADASEAKIRERLADINKQINAPPQKSMASVPVSDNGQSAQLERLEKLLKQKQTEVSAPDPQMAQLNGMLEKIQQIQNPGLVQEKLKEKKAADDKKHATDSAFKAIPAVIDGNQKVLTGGAVRLKLTDSMRIGGLLLKAGQVLSGACNVTNQRLLLDIRNIRLGTSIVPVNLTVFSLDGMPGIPAPEAELNEAAGGGTADALESMQFLSMDESVGTQAASAGINAAKGLLGKKARRIKVKLHGGQQVLLRLNHS